MKTFVRSNAAVCNAKALPAESAHAEDVITARLTKQAAVERAYSSVFSQSSAAA
jgi:hypothetical protein